LPKTISSREASHRLLPVAVADTVHQRPDTTAEDQDQARPSAAARALGDITRPSRYVFAYDLRYGGTNDLNNLVPVLRTVHQQEEFNRWWMNYGE